MALFKKKEMKKKSEPVEAYTPQQNELKAEEPAPVEEDLSGMILNNQAIISKNQQGILNAIGALHARIEELAAEDEDEGEELEEIEEPEELEEPEEVEEPKKVKKTKKAKKK